MLSAPSDWAYSAILRKKFSFYTQTTKKSECRCAYKKCNGIKNQTKKNSKMAIKNVLCRLSALYTSCCSATCTSCVCNLLPKWDKYYEWLSKKVVFSILFRCFSLFFFGFCCVRRKHLNNHLPADVIFPHKLHRIRRFVHWWCLSSY